ncbi:hypothetical protein GQ42DRAFT_175799 [Ramicandelaber brevisporus]|nr:hypothetical protein GQ42DRAFT_175799 [Ramicandelaber brevisporus]
MPRVLIFGGCAHFAGRHLVELLISNRHADPLVPEFQRIFSLLPRPFATTGAGEGEEVEEEEEPLEIRVVDKTRPDLAGFPQDIIELFKQNVDVRQGNMWRNEFIESCFRDDDSAGADGLNGSGPSSTSLTSMSRTSSQNSMNSLTGGNGRQQSLGPPGRPWDLVVILTAVVKFSQAESYSRESIVGNVKRIVDASEKFGARQIVYLSHQYINRSDGTLVDETTPTINNLPLSEYFIAAEEYMLASERRVPTVVLRPSPPYGPGDYEGFAPTLITIELCRRYREPMPCYSSPSHFLSLVHVRDVARAIVHSAIWHAISVGTINKRSTIVHTASSGSDISNTEVFMLSDGQNRPCALEASIMSESFQVKTKLLSKVARLVMSTMSPEKVTETLNVSAVQDWVELIRTSGCKVSRLSPYVDPDLLRTCYDFSPRVNVDKLRNSGFVWKCPENLSEYWSEIVDEWKAMNIWPSEDATLPNYNN